MIGPHESSSPSARRPDQETTEEPPQHESAWSAKKSLYDQLQIVRGEDIIPLARQALEVFAWSEHQHAGKGPNDPNLFLSAMHAVDGSPIATQIRENFLLIPVDKEMRKIPAPAVGIRETMVRYTSSKFSYRYFFDVFHTSGLIPSGAGVGAKENFLDLQQMKKRHYAQTFEAIEKAVDSPSPEAERRQAALYLSVMAQIALSRLQQIAVRLVSEGRSQHITPGMEKEYWKHQLIGTSGNEGVIFCEQYAKEALAKFHEMALQMWPTSHVLMKKIWDVVSSAEAITPISQNRLANHQDAIISALVKGNTTGAYRALLIAAQQEPDLFQDIVYEKFGKRAKREVGSHLGHAKASSGEHEEEKDTSAFREKGERGAETRRIHDEDLEKEFIDKVGHIFELMIIDGKGNIIPSGRLFMLVQRNMPFILYDTTLGKQRHAGYKLRIKADEYRMQDGVLQQAGGSPFSTLRQFKAYFDTGRLIDRGKNTAEIAKPNRGKLITRSKLDRPKSTDTKEREIDLFSFHNHLLIDTESMKKAPDKPITALFIKVSKGGSGKITITMYPCEMRAQSNVAQIGSSRKRNIEDFASMMESGRYADAGRFIYDEKRGLRSSLAAYSMFNHVDTFLKDHKE